MKRLVSRPVRFYKNFCGYYWRYWKVYTRPLNCILLLTMVALLYTMSYIQLKMLIWNKIQPWKCENMTDWMWKDDIFVFCIFTTTQFEGWERKMSKCFFAYTHLDLFCSHPWTMQQCQKAKKPTLLSLCDFRSPDFECEKAKLGLIECEKMKQIMYHFCTCCLSYFHFFTSKNAKKVNTHWHNKLSSLCVFTFPHYVMPKKMKICHYN